MAIILAFLFIFQILLLQPFYEMVKKNDLINTANEVEDYLGYSNLNELIQQNSDFNEICIMVINENDGLTLNSNIGCPINRLSEADLIYYTDEAIKNGGTLMVETAVPTVEINQKEGAKSVGKAFDSLMYFKVVNYQGSNYFIIVNSNITPINATTRTLSIQLLFISIIVIGATLILTYILTKRFVEPIEKINLAAKELSEGKYNSLHKGANSKEIYELNDTLVQAADDINKADKAKRDLIANVSHDLRTPLTMIGGYGEMMLDLPDEKTDENIKVIVDEAKRLSSLVNDLLDFSKLQENKIEINAEEFNLTLLIKNVLTKYNFFVQSENFDIRFNYDEEVIVKGDDLRISQVLHNFISNAINYSGENKKIIINQTVENEFVKIEVIDFGRGIDKASLPLIWDRYYKADKEHLRSTTGSGIGLAIAKEILELHNVEYGADSNLNEGSVFYFKMPVVNLKNELS